MKASFRGQVELRRFEDEIIGRRAIHDIATGQRRFEAMADIESVLLLQLGVELGIFPLDEASIVFTKYQRRVLASLRRVEKLEWPSLFGNELQVLKRQLHDHDKDPLLTPNPHKLSAKLFEKPLIEIILHEIGREFRDGKLTMAVSFDDSADWSARLEGRIQPDEIFRDDQPEGLSLLIERYLAFLSHAANLEELWKYLADTSQTNHASSELEKILRSIHSWRLDLKSPGVKRRFEQITTVFASALDTDPQLAEIGFEISEFCQLVTRLCRSWSGDDELMLDLPFNDRQGGGNVRAA